MSAVRSGNLPSAATHEPTPKPASAVGLNSSTVQAPTSSRHGAEREAMLLEYFANPSPEMCEIDMAWEEALTLYGDEDSDAWVSALEDGTHPLCRVQKPKRSA